MNITGKYDLSGIDIFGSAESLRELSKALHESEGIKAFSLLVSSSPPTPYFGYLKTLTIERSPGNVCVSRVEDVMAIVGSAEKLASLARNIEYLADKQNSANSEKIPAHLHVEYFPGHFYLEKKSLPLVVTKQEGSL